MEVKQTKAVSFEVNDSGDYGEGALSIEKLKEGKGFLLVFRNKAKNIVFSGALVPQASQVISESGNKIRILAFRKAAEQGKGSFAKQSCSAQVKSFGSYVKMKNGLSESSLRAKKPKKLS